MSKSAPRVLVIDDDEVVLAAVADLLEAASFSVSCHSSPAGAAGIAEADRSLVAVVVDLNMPIMRGDNVARMFLSRASLRDLPLILLSGDTAETLEAVRAKIPHVKVVAKAEMEKKLVPVLKEAIAERVQRTTRRKWGSEPSVIVMQEDDNANARFFAQLAEDMALAREIWREVRASNLQRLHKLATVLRTLCGEADRRALFRASQMLRGIEQIIHELLRGTKLRASTDTSVERAIEALSVMSKTQVVGSKFVADPIIDALRRAASELKAGDKA
jgi:CheY-like chemotaxis protein